MNTVSHFYDPYGAFAASRGSWHKSAFHAHHMRPCGGDDLEESLEPIPAILREHRLAGFELVMPTSYNIWHDASEAAESEGIAVLSGQEYVELDGILLVGTKRLHTGSPQEVIDATVREGGFAIICHPNQNPELSDRNPIIPQLIPDRVSRALTGVIGVEIYNGCLPHRDWEGVPFGRGIATDYWDEALTSGRLLWGFATDDSHFGFEINQGWTDVWADGADLASIRAAAHRGSLVASRGLRLYDWSFDGGILAVEADQPYARERSTTYSFIGERGDVLDVQRGTRAVYTFTGDELYVRVEATSPDGSRLWTQPIVRREAFDLGITKPWAEAVVGS